MPVLRNFYPGDLIKINTHYYLLIEKDDKKDLSFEYDRYASSLYQVWWAYSFCAKSGCSWEHDDISDYRFYIDDCAIFCGNNLYD
jgi:hypothetical protein